MKLRLLFLPIAFFSTTLCAQQIVLQPNGTDGIDASLGYHDNFDTDNNNYGTDAYLKAYCIPGASGGRNSNRAVIKFDLSSIPAGVTITSAYLELTATGYLNNLLPGHFGNNSAYLTRIGGTWQENTITWSNAPAIDASNQILIPPSSNSTQNYSVNVSAMVAGMYANPATNYGFNLQLVTEDPNDAAGITFYSSDYNVAAYRPKLIINYSQGKGSDIDSLCTTSDGINGTDASLGYHDNYNAASTNYGNDLYFKAFCMPGASGGTNSNRGLLYFDLSSVPAGSDVVSATLNLYGTGYLNALLPGHYGNNAAKVYRVTSPWTENTVTWNTQPTYSATDYASLPASVNSTQDYQITTTALVEYMVQHPSTNYGFLLQLDSENPVDDAALAFHSSDGANSAKYPKLCLTYKIGYLTVETEIYQPEAGLQLILFPNPTNGELTIELTEGAFDASQLVVYDAMGKIVKLDYNLVNDKTIVISTENLANGYYAIRYLNSQHSFIKQ
ncbi:MAG TPA: DNRLRE domain-containing protein [Fluviicola sp.]|nr:DNRLRE domain-containing protein [Fluviicola sp.]